MSAPLSVVYAAGGTPHAMFPLAPAELVRVCGGTLADVALLAPSWPAREAT
jgi:hypothetical protein